MNGRKDQSKKRVNRWFWVGVEVLPIVLPAAITAFGVVAIFFLIIGQLRNEFVWPLGLLAAGAATYAVVKFARVERPGSHKEQRVCDLLVIAAVIVWGMFNVLYTSQHIFTNRDPATYSVAGALLTERNDLQLREPTVFGEVTGVIGASAGFGAYPIEGDKLYAQGLHLLPTFLGLGGRIVGEEYLMRLNPLFGMTALLAVYAFARLLVRPRWALVAVGTLAVSLPMLYFTRDTYTEPLAATFTFGALALLWAAQKSKHLSLWLLAGLVAGAGTLTRIDAYFTIIGFVVFAALYLAIAKKSERKTAAKRTGLLALGMSTTTLLGWLDLSLVSTKYYMSLLPRYKQQLLLLAVMVVIGLVIVALSWRTRVLPWLDAKTKKWRVPGAAIGIVLITLALMSRPFWQIAHHQFNIPVVADIQLSTGQAIDGMRSYAEQTTNWVAWYIGPIMAILGVIGIALSAARAMKRRDLLLITSLAVVIGTSLVFLIRPSITPDQIWASRRLLPVILPGIAVFGAVGFEYVYERYLKKMRLGKAITGVTLALIFALPLFISQPFWFVRDTARLASFEKLCPALPQKSAVLWVGISRLEAIQPTQAFCNVPAMGYRDDGPDINGAPDISTLAQVAKNAKKTGVMPIIAVYGRQIDLIAEKDRKNMQEVSIHTHQELGQTLTQPPRGVVSKTESILIGVLQTDGSIGLLARPD